MGENARLMKIVAPLAHVGGWEFDTRKGVVTWTDEVARIHDLPPGTPMTVGAGLRRFYADDDRQRMQSAVEEAIRTGKPYDLELPIVTAKRRHKWVRIIGRPVLKHGKTVKVRGSLQDITTTKLAETALSADIRAVKQLHELGMLSAREETLAPVLTRILEAAIAVSSADFGTVQLVNDASGELEIVAHRGLPKWWVRFWNRVPKGRGTCGTALKRQRRVIVRDIEKSRIFKGTPGLAIQRRAGVRAVQSTPLVSRSGKVLGMFSTHYRRPTRPNQRVLAILDLLARQAADLIEHTQSEAALRLSRSRLAAAQRIGHTGSWEWDIRSGRVAWSDELYAIYGLDRHTFEPTISSFIQYVHPDDLRRVRQVIQTVLTTGRSVDFEFRIRRTDGSVRSLHAVGQVTTVDDRGRPVLMVGVNQDITERKQAEDASAATRAKLVAAMESMSDAVYISDAQGNFVDVNQAFVTFHRFRSKEECGRTLADYSKRLDVFMADGRRAPLANWAVPRALRGETGVNVEYGLRRRDTGERWVGSYSFGPIRDSRGRITGSVVVGRDITGQKAAQDALKTLNETLEQRVAERTAALSELNLRLERRVAERTAEVTRANEHLHKLNARLIDAQENERRRIARELHDDLIQRLASVAIDLDVLEREARGFAARRGTVTTILKRVKQIIADARHLSGRLHPAVLEHLGLGAAVGVLAREFSKGRTLSVEVRIRNMPEDIPAEIATCVYRVAQESLHNVVKHAQASRVRIHLAGTDQGIALRVSDNGIGMKRHATKARRLGLGLTSMNERVGLLGGRFRVATPATGGTRIQAWVPLRTSTAKH